MIGTSIMKELIVLKNPMDPAISSEKHKIYLHTTKRVLT